MELASRFGAGVNSGVNLFGIIKEVAPVSGAETDEILGVEVFQTKYFLDNPIYIDIEKEFYSALGGKSLLAQPLTTWNPFQLYSDFKAMSARLKNKKVDGNLKGEGLLKGGLIIVTAKDGVIYEHKEVTGSCMPYDEIEEIVKSLREKKESST